MSDPRKNPLYVRDCKLCGAPLGFAKTAIGGTVPLDLRAPVYAPTDHGQCVRTDLSYVSHFASCPKAAEFSKK